MGAGSRLRQRLDGVGLTSMIGGPVQNSERRNWMSPQRLLKFALATFGTIFLLVYPLAIVWPSGWAWHAGAPHDSQYFMMIVGVYATLGVFLLMAVRNPQTHRSLIWFAVWSSIVHGVIMAVQSIPAEHHRHLVGDVPALLLVAIVLGGLLVWSDAERGKTAPIPSPVR
jgi:hypothetical protein